jgi:hypothetical protein
VTCGYGLWSRHRSAVVARERFEWRHRSAKRAVSRVGWTVVAAALAIGPAWLLFGREPRVIKDGAINPFALVVPLLAALFGLVTAVQVLAIVRRPVVTADHYAVRARPGVVRMLVLPWAQIAELATMEVDEEPLLLIRCLPQPNRSADWPRWWDQAHLRSARRAASAVSAYDLAVPMSDFIGAPRNLLAELAWWAPEHVTVADRGRW